MSVYTGELKVLHSYTCPSILGGRKGILSVLHWGRDVTMTTLEKPFS